MIHTYTQASIGKDFCNIMQGVALALLKYVQEYILCKKNVVKRVKTAYFLAINSAVETQGE